MPEARRTFGPVALLGLAGSGLAAVAGNRAWVAWTGEGDGGFSAIQLTGSDSATVPLAGALALVVLASWGVVLVTRGRFRRLVAALGLVTSVGMVATAALGLRSATSGLRGDLERLGVQDHSSEVQGWFWAYLAAAVLSVAATGLALRWLPEWPEMGTRYDAPGGVERHEQTDLDLWKAMDEGTDPTLTDPPRRDP